MSKPKSLKITARDVTQECRSKRANYKLDDFQLEGAFRGCAAGPKTPKKAAKEFESGTIKEGRDGKRYVAVSTKRWEPVSKAGKATKKKAKAKAKTPKTPKTPKTTRRRADINLTTFDTPGDPLLRSPTPTPRPRTPRSTSAQSVGSVSRAESSDRFSPATNLSADFDAEAAPNLFDVMPASELRGPSPSPPKQKRRAVLQPVTSTDGNISAASAAPADDFEKRFQENYVPDLEAKLKTMEEAKAYYQQFTKEQLQELARDAGVTVGGSKEELIDKIAAADAGVGVEAPPSPKKKATQKKKATPKQPTQRLSKRQRNIPAGAKTPTKRSKRIAGKVRGSGLGLGPRRPKTLTALLTGGGFELGHDYILGGHNMPAERGGGFSKFEYRSRNAVQKRKSGFPDIGVPKIGKPILKSRAARAGIGALAAAAGTAAGAYMLNKRLNRNVDDAFEIIDEGDFPVEEIVAWPRSARMAANQKGKGFGKFGRRSSTAGKYDSPTFMKKTKGGVTSRAAKKAAKKAAIALAAAGTTALALKGAALAAHELTKPKEIAPFSPIDPRVKGYPQDVMDEFRTAPIQTPSRRQIIFPDLPGNKEFFEGSRFN